jgi:hypothetical protein
MASSFLSSLTTLVTVPDEVVPAGQPPIAPTTGGPIPRHGSISSAPSSVGSGCEARPPAPDAPASGGPGRRCEQRWPSLYLPAQQAHKGAATTLPTSLARPYHRLARRLPSLAATPRPKIDSHPRVPLINAATMAAAFPAIPAAAAVRPVRMTSTHG